MSKFFLIVSIFFYTYNIVYADKIVSDAKMDSLIKSADAVILINQRIFRVINENEGELFVRFKIRINNIKGEEYCERTLHESEFISIEEIEAQITDTSGNINKELDDDDIEEANISSGNILYDENRYKYFKLSHNTYPYILEYSYKKSYASHFFWPGWYPQSGVPTLLSMYKLIIEEPVKYKTYSIGLDILSKKSEEDGNTVLTWTLKNIPKRKKEKHIPPENKGQMALYFEPIKFQLGDSKGKTSTWDDLADWYRNLTSDKYNLPLDNQQEIKNLLEGIENPYEIIRTLYKYLQHQTRYVAVYLDIGGWEPHSASSTYKNHYGDCKDLSTLMVAMLKVAGIKAYPALVLTRDRGIVITEFPSSQFNHCITFIPLDNDTLWLECTSDLYDSSEMPAWIEDIYAFVIKDDGGEIIRTPKAQSNRNVWGSNSELELHNSGMLFIESSVQTTGIKKFPFKPIFEFYQPEDEKIRLQEIFGSHLPNLTIDRYNYEELENEKRSFIIKFSGIYKRAFPRTGSRLFLNPNIFNRCLSEDMPEEKDRKFPIYVNEYPYQNIDTVKIKLPYGYKLEAAPQEIELDESFARYKTEYKYENKTLFYVRYFEYKTNHFSVELYDRFLNFLKTVVKTDQTKFVFKKG